MHAILTVLSRDSIRKETDVHIYIYLCIYICIHVYTCRTHKYICVYMYIHVYIYICTDICIYAHLCLHVWRLHTQRDKCDVIHSCTHGWFSTTRLNHMCRHDSFPFPYALPSGCLCHAQQLGVIEDSDICDLFVLDKTHSYNIQRTHILLDSFGHDSHECTQRQNARETKYDRGTWHTWMIWGGYD